MNRRELHWNLSRITGELLRKKGYIAPVDVFLGLGYLSPQDYQAWQRKRVPFLEQVLQVNLSKINFILRSVCGHCRKGGLRESWTDYRSWGRGKQARLRFSKSGEEALERAYATHFLKPPPTGPQKTEEQRKMLSQARIKGKIRARADSVKHPFTLWEEESGE